MKKIKNADTYVPDFYGGEKQRIVEPFFDRFYQDYSFFGDSEVGEDSASQKIEVSNFFN